MTLRLAPITLTAARRMVADLHSHNGPPQGWLFGVCVVDGERRCAVGMAGRPVARKLDDGYTIEVTRVATDGTKRACSMLYMALCRAGTNLGYREAKTYTLEHEDATALIATGWEREGVTVPAGADWNMPSRPRVVRDLFGNRTTPPEAKVRWRRSLSRPAAKDHAPQEVVGAGMTG